jgi:hypothetical protein
MDRDHLRWPLHSGIIEFMDATRIWIKGTQPLRVHVHENVPVFNDIHGASTT